jgi:hypothetical protein
MLLDTDTFLVTVYVLVDDLYRTEYAPKRPRRPGPAPAMSDSEVLTLALLGQWRHDQSERAFVAWVRRHWQSYFPRMLTQGAFNRRVRDLSGVLLALGPRLHEALAFWLHEDPLYEVLDAVPVPLMKRCRGERQRLFAPDEAAVGKGGSDRAWQYGVSLLDAASPFGTITGLWWDQPTPKGTGWRKRSCGGGPLRPLPHRPPRNWNRPWEAVPIRLRRGAGDHP